MSQLERDVYDILTLRCEFVSEKAVFMSIGRIDLHDPTMAQRVLVIQQAAYTIEAQLIGTFNIPPLNDTLETLQASGETFYGCWMVDEIAGLVACTYDRAAHELDICRMAVHPDYFRRGIASALLTFVQTAYPETLRCIVSTGAKNEPAKALYRRDGFVQTGEVEVEPGVWLAFFEKKSSPQSATTVDP